MKKLFNDGDYIVILSTCTGNNNIWHPRICVGYCYRLSQNVYSEDGYHCLNFAIEMDNSGNKNGWSCLYDTSYDSKLIMRFANSIEVFKYKKLGRPVKVDIKDDRMYKLERLNMLSGG